MQEDNFSLVDEDGNKVKATERGLLLFNGGTVCDDNFDENSAEAICRQMGYSGILSWTSGTYYDIQQDLEINLDDIECTDNSWSSCIYSETNNCGHGEDVFLSCETGKIIF